MKTVSRIHYLLLVVLTALLSFDGFSQNVDSLGIVTSVADAPVTVAPVADVPVADEPAVDSIDVPVDTFVLPMATGYDWVTYRGKADIIDTGGTRTCNFFLVNRTDSILYLNIHAYGVEVMRAVFTPDSIKYVNKLTSQYFLGTYAPFEKYFRIPIDFQMIQGIFNGNTERVPPGQKLSFEYSAFMPVDSTSSFFTEFDFKELNRVLEVKGKIKVVRLNVPGVTSIRIPEKFERIAL